MRANVAHQWSFLSNKKLGMLHGTLPGPVPLPLGKAVKGRDLCSDADKQAFFWALEELK